MLSGGGTPGKGRIVGTLRLLMGAMAVARFQRFALIVPQSVPTTDTLERVADLVAAGEVRPVIDQTFTLADTASAIKYMETEHARGKVVISIA